MNYTITDEGVKLVQRMVLLIGIPVVLLVVGAIVGVIYMLIRGRRNSRKPEA